MNADGLWYLLSTLSYGSESSCCLIPIDSVDRKVSSWCICIALRWALCSWVTCLLVLPVWKPNTFGKTPVDWCLMVRSHLNQKSALPISSIFSGPLGLFMEGVGFGFVLPATLTLKKNSSFSWASWSSWKYLWWWSTCLLQGTLRWMSCPSYGNFAVWRIGDGCPRERCRGWKAPMDLCQCSSIHTFSMVTQGFLREVWWHLRVGDRKRDGSWADIRRHTERIRAIKIW